jgi:TP901 family phage tail tape measure protein
MSYKERIIFSISSEGAEVTKAQIDSIKTSFKNAGIQVDKVTESLGKNAQHFGTVNTSTMKLIANGIKLALAFRLLYGVLNAVSTFITSNIKAWTDLDDTMARVRTVTRDTGEGMATIMRVFAKEVQSYAMDSRESIGDIGSVLYWLGTAGLNTQEQLGGLAPVMDLVTGTMGNTKEIARLMAGTFNTLGDTVEGATSTQDKFRKMSDIMAYTFSKEEMELSDLASALQYVAGDAKNVGLNFTELVTVIGFLNTHLLKGSKSGMSLSQAFVQILKNSEKLANKLGVTFEKDQPYVFLDVMDKIVGALEKIGINSARSQTILSSIFGARSIRPIQRMVAHWDELKESIKNAGVESAGFAEKLREIRMDTINAQTARMNNIIQVSAQNFLSAALGTGDFVDGLKKLNESLKDVPDNATRAGVSLKTFSRIPTVKLFDITGISQLIHYFSTYDANLKKQMALESLTSRERRVGAKSIADFEERSQKVNLDYEKERQEALRNTLEVMKVMGASEIAILQQELSLTEQILDEDNRSLEQVKLKNKIYESTLKYIEDIADTEMEHSLDMSKIAGITEIEIAKEKLKYAKQLDDPLTRQKETLLARNEVERAYLQMLADEKAKIDSNVDILAKLLKLSQSFLQGDVAKELIQYTLGKKTYKELSADAQGKFATYFPQEAKTQAVTKGLGELGIDFEELDKYKNLNLRRREEAGRGRAQAAPEVRALLKADVSTKSEVDVSINLNKSDVKGLLKDVGWEALGDDVKDYITKVLSSAEFNTLIKNKIEKFK